MDLENLDKTFRIDSHRGPHLKRRKRIRIKNSCMKNLKKYIMYLLKVTPS
jgi:hypothetical protein